MTELSCNAITEKRHLLFHCVYLEEHGIFQQFEHDHQAIVAAFSEI